MNGLVFQQTFRLFFPKNFLGNRSTAIRCLLAILLIGVDVVATFFIPYSTKNLIEALNANLLTLAGSAVFFLGVFWTLGKIVSHIQELIFFPVINTTIRNLTHRVVEHLHHIPLIEYQKLSTPEVLNAIRRISLSARFFIRIVFLLAIPATLKLLIAIGLTLQAGTFGFTLIPLILIALYLLYIGTHRYTEQRQLAWQMSDQINRQINDSIMNTKFLRFFKAHEMRSIGKCLTQEALLWQKANSQLHWVYIFLGLLLGSGITLVLALALIAIEKQQLSFGDFVFLKTQLIAAFLPLKNFSVEFRQLNEAMVDIKKILEILSIPKETKRPEPTRATLHLQSVCFSYQETPLFHHLSYHFQPNEHVGIIGASGSGKSTLLNLLSGLYQPSHGTITRPTLHYIPQDIKAFNQTLYDNLTYGVKNPSQRELHALCEDFELLELLRSLPEGLSTPIGEMGIRLSGGEKQKVALIRAMLHHPSTLLLDETLSSINPEAEDRILDVLFARVPCVILTSHRLSSLKRMDRVLTLHKGQLIEIAHLSPALVS